MPSPTAWYTASARILQEERRNPVPDRAAPSTEAGRAVKELERFWNKVVAEPGSDCWVFVGARDRKGYGSFDHQRAHRYVWQAYRGPIPEGMLVCHRCDNPPCVKLGHLFLGSPADNMRDRDQKGRAATGDRNGSRTRPDRRPRGSTMRHPRPGALNGRAKLTEQDVADIRRRSAAGETGTAIAASFGVNPTTVRRIVRGTRWGHGS